MHKKSSWRFKIELSQIKTCYLTHNYHIGFEWQEMYLLMRKKMFWLVNWYNNNRDNTSVTEYDYFKNSKFGIFF